jgi:hypothetical protein
MLLMLLWRSGDHVGGETGVWFRWKQKLDWVLMILRDRWYWWDEASLAVIGLILLMPIFLFRRMEYSRNLAASAIFLAIVFVCLPRIVFGSNYADMRLAPSCSPCGDRDPLPPRLDGPRRRRSSRSSASPSSPRASAPTRRASGCTTAPTTASCRRGRTSRGRRAWSPSSASACRRQWGMSRLEHLPASRWCAATPSPTTNGR